MDLYTKNGWPLQVKGDHVYSKTGKFVGIIYDDKVYGPNGRYVGTIEDDRLYYRSVDGAMIRPISSAGSIGSTGRAKLVGSAMWGSEPNIPQ